MFRSYADVMRTKPDSTDSEDDSNKKMYFCEICNDGWSSETEVVIHQAVKHKNYINQLYCESDVTLCKICVREFEDNSKLLGHIKSAHLLSSETALRVEREIFACDICSSIFFNKMMLEYHILYKHMPRMVWKKVKMKCPLCLKTFKVTKSYCHFRTHNLHKIACCKICLKKFRDLKHLAKHMKVHTPLYKCEICRYEGMKAELFRKHIQSAHKRNCQQIDDRAINLDKYFIFASDPKQWKRFNLISWRGLDLTNDVHVCVLCREICVGDDSKKQHILLDHNMDGGTCIINYLCSCGMAFANKLLLKHHRLKFKEEHTD